MKKLIAILCCVAGSGCATFQQPGDEWFAEDKGRHFAVSATTSALVTHRALRQGRSEGEARMWAFGVTLSLGAGKEIYDREAKKTYFSGKDMVWNLLGTTVGNTLITLAD